MAVYQPRWQLTRGADFSRRNNRREFMRYAVSTAQHLAKREYPRGDLRDDVRFHTANLIPRIEGLIRKNEIMHVDRLKERLLREKLLKEKEQAIADTAKLVEDLTSKVDEVKAEKWVALEAASKQAIVEKKLKEMEQYIQRRSSEQSEAAKKVNEEVRKPREDALLSKEQATKQMEEVLELRKQKHALINEVAAKDSSIRLLTNSVVEERAKYVALSATADKEVADLQFVLDEQAASSFERMLAEEDREWLWKNAVPHVTMLVRDEESFEESVADMLNASPQAGMSGFSGVA